MTSRATASVLATREPRVSRLAVAAIALLIAGVLTAVDVSWEQDIVISAVVLAPFVVSLLAGPRDTALVGVLVVLIVVASGSWNDNFGDAAFFLRLVLVAVGGAVSVVAARGRVRASIDKQRFALLSALAEVGDERADIEQTAARLCELIVPGFADICIVDVADGDELRRVGVKASPSAGSGGEARLRPLTPASALARASLTDLRVIDSHSPPPQGMAGAGGFDDEHLDAFAAMRCVSALTVPLRARGRTLGVLTLLVCQGSSEGYTRYDLEFAEVLAGRAALALDSAGLSSDLQASEAQLTTALGSLAEAVTVQSPQGNLVYANDAAARLLGFASPQELLDTPVTAILDRFDSYLEDGSPLELSDLPGRRVLAGMEPQPLEIRAIDKRTGEEQWRLSKSTGVRGPDGELQLVVNVIADITAAKRAEMTQRLLARAGEVLVSSLDYEQTLQEVADLAVPRLGDWCAVSLPDGRGHLPSVAVAHVDPQKVSMARRLGELYPVSVDEVDGVAQVFREGTVQCVNDIDDEMLVLAARDPEHLQTLRGLGMRAALIVPMTSGGGTVGVLTLVSAESGRSFSDEDIALAAELARRAGIAVENARLYTERTQIARTLQRSLLPADLPPLPGWRTSALYRPAGHENWVGGDFYDAFAIEGGQMIVVGDVTGRGAQAAALTGLMRHTLRTAGIITGSAREALRALNNELLRGPELSLCTAVCVVLRDAGDEARAEIYCAGHPLPLLTREGSAQYVGRTGIVLGVDAEADWEPATLAMLGGDVLTLYSDGAPDTVGAHDRFGPDRLREAVAGASNAAGVVRCVDEALIAFQVGEQADDTAVLAIERVGPPGSREG